MSVFDIFGVIVYDYLWGTPMVLFILAVGLYFTLRSGLFQFRFFGHAMKYSVKRLFGKSEDKDSGDGTLSPLQAVSTALGSTIGTGNISGVATAVVTGGPGAIFWMWIAGCFGMLIKMVEITLAVHFRKKDSEGNPYGGPTFYIETGFAKQRKLKKIAWTLIVLFCIGFFIGFFINIQTYTVAEAISTTFNMGMIPVAVVYSILLFIMIMGGLKKVGEWCSLIVPIMCLVYLGGGVFIILKNIAVVPGIIKMIFVSAFTPTAAMGGFAGATVAAAMKVGMARSVYSNEAGWGTAPMIHSTAKVDHPVKQGMIGIFEVFVDTFIVCTITALVVLVSGLWNTGIDGANLTLSAFEQEMGGFGRIIIALAVFLFGITTASGIYVQSEVILRFLFKKENIVKAIISVYKVLYPLFPLIMVFIAVYNGLPGATMWMFADAGTSFPIIVNMIAMLVMFPTFLKLLKDYKARYMHIGTIDPEMRIFYDEQEKH